MWGPLSSRILNQCPSTDEGAARSDQWEAERSVSFLLHLVKWQDALLQSSSSSKSAMLVMTTGSSLPTLLILFELCCFFAFRFLVGPSTFSLLLFVFSLSFHPRCHNCCLHGCSLRCVRSRLWFICWYMYLFFASLCYSRCYSFLCSCFSVLCSYLLRCHCHW